MAPWRSLQPLCPGSDRRPLVIQPIAWQWGEGNLVVYGQCAVCGHYYSLAGGNLKDMVVCKHNHQVAGSSNLTVCWPGFYSDECRERNKCCPIPYGAMWGSWEKWAKNMVYGLSVGRYEWQFLDRKILEALRSPEGLDPLLLGREAGKKPIIMTATFVSIGPARPKARPAKVKPAPRLDVSPITGEKKRRIKRPSMT